jgi:CDP-diacylglycerol--serine O-phosphatidyltransferase
MTWSQVLVKTLPVVSIGVGLLMVSRIRYIHFGNVFLRGKRPLVHVMLMVVAALLIILAPELALTTYIFLYALSGPVLALVRRIQKPRHEQTVAVTESAPQTDAVVRHTDRTA